ncbi:hypothetical protein LCGC14_2941940, partial [marine sediment metagenome]
MADFHSRITELEKDYKKLFKTVHGITPDDVDNLQERIEKIEQILIFPDDDWISIMRRKYNQVRKRIFNLGLRTQTSQAKFGIAVKTEIDNNTELIREFNRKRVKEIKELKNRCKKRGDLIVDNCGEIKELKEILREHYNEHKRIQNDNVYDEVFPIDEAWENHLKNGLKKLGGEKTVGGNAAPSISLKSSLGKPQFKTDSKPPSIASSASHTEQELINTSEPLYEFIKTHPPKEKENPSKQDPLGIEGKYEAWTREELINECYNLVSNMEAMESLHIREKKTTELVDFDLYSHEGVTMYNAKTQVIV